MSSLHLFDTPTLAGYRLKTLEVFNWGTFHEGTTGKDIWKLSLEGQNTLLTGANGSGKTTLVDALLALLVNPQKRFFNQSSGAKSSKERSEESYVEGHYGRTQSEEQQNARVEKLRPNRAETFSVILGVFTNETAGSVPVTLVQIRWFNNSGLQRKYLVAKTELSIAGHIQFSTDNVWLRKLRRQFGDRIEDFDSFPKYAERFMRLFGMQSEKALSLFNQTVGMKVLGDLDEFIRLNMLEESGAEAAFKKLMDNYQTLLRAYQDLDKARTQLNLLEPVYRLSHEHGGLEARINEKSEQYRLLEPWFAREQIRLWQEERDRQERNLEGLEDKLSRQEITLAGLDDRRVQLEIAMNNNQVAAQIKELEKEIKGLEKAKGEKEQYVKDYNKLARAVQLVENPDEAAFGENMERAVALQAALGEEKKQLEDQKFDTRTSLNGLDESFRKLTAEITQLQHSTGKVTGRPAEIRQELLEVVGATEAEIPFVAEVIQVREDEKARWNNAIEKVLHNFGRCLLVPDKHYSEVTAYVNGHPDLKGKIVFHHVTAKPVKSLPPDGRALVTKLDFNPKSQYAAWVESHIAAQFNYLCTESQAEFERAEKALLPSGLHRNKNRHERDDTSSQRHILGWDNRDLLREKQRAGRDLHENIIRLEKALVNLKKETEKNETKKSIVDKLLELKQFSKLDWQADALRIEELAKQKENLENSNETLQTLREQLGKLKKEIKALGEEKDKTRDTFRDTEQQLGKLRLEQNDARHLLDVFDSDTLGAALDSLTDLTRELVPQLTYLKFKAQKEAFKDGIKAALEALGGQKHDLERRIRSAMTAFKSPAKEIKMKFPDWDSENYNLGSEIDQLPEYVDRYQQIRDENIVQLEGRFREEFNKGAIKALTDYCGSLELHHEQICETIRQINESLEGITFNLNPDTYIQLERKDSRRPCIREFRFEKFSSWQPDLTLIALAKDPKEALLTHFVEKIEPFIRELQENEKWRQEVTDVRNWSEFKAREYYKADKTPKPGGSYESSGSLSGGEAAQLAYTVLGAAIAYQFGINRETGGHKSFRFIVVDEAFSKLDEDKSKYLMQLCRGLGLQLMVVTPLTSIDLLEKDVSVIHWVTKASQDRRKSTVRDIPILEYREKKEALLAEATEA